MIQSFAPKCLMTALALALTQLPTTGVAQTGGIAPESDEEAMVSTLEARVAALLEQARSELATVDEMLFDDPEDPDLLAVQADLIASIAQLEQLLSLLSEPADQLE